MKKRILYESVYKKLNKITPLWKDCGLLCGHACCHGSNQETLGMYLYPGEEVMINGDVNKGFTVTQTNLKYADQFGIRHNTLLLVCNGECDRNLRPLSCRMFPLVPYIDRKDILKVKIDPRARAICPLTETKNTALIEDKFLYHVRNSAQMLAKDEEIREFIKALSLVLDEYERNPFYSRQIQFTCGPKSLEKSWFAKRLKALAFGRKRF